MEKVALIFTYDDSNATSIAYEFESYEEAKEAVIKYFSVDENDTREEVEAFLEEIEIGKDRWMENGKSWEIMPLLGKNKFGVQ